MNETLAGTGLEKAPDKTFIGRVERGFDFLGYHFVPGRLRLADATMERFVESARRLYEQERGKSDGFPQLGACVRRGSAGPSQFSLHLQPRTLFAGANELSSQKPLE